MPHDAMPAKSGNTNWFEDEFGFVETKPFSKVQEAFDLRVSADNEVTLVSRANGRSFHVGPFETPSVLELRQRLGGVVHGW